MPKFSRQSAGGSAARAYLPHGLPGLRPAMTKGNERKRFGGETPTDAKLLLPCLRARPRLERQAPSIGVPPRFWLRRPNATTRLQFRATWDGARKRALSANRPVSVQRSSSQTGRSAGRAGARSRPGAGCKSARGRRTRPVLRPAGRSTSDWARFESICNWNSDNSQ